MTEVRHIWLVWDKWRNGKRVVHWKEIAPSDDRLDWEWPNCPKGKVKFRPTRRSAAWLYVDHGATREVAAARINYFGLRKIAELRDAIAKAESELVRP